MSMERLQKILARAGIASRRDAELMILDRRVKVNGRVVKELGARADAARDHIKVDDRLIVMNKVIPRYFLCYKPRRMITSLSDPQDRPSIGRLLKERRIRHRLYPVGRLDWDAEGLLILTNDGELANKIMHPKANIPKIYIVEVLGRPEEKSLAKLRKGIFLEPGIRTMAAQIVARKPAGTKAQLKVTLYEGRKNQIKRMFARIGHRVTAIKRIAIGPLSLAGMKPGDIRPMTRDEISQFAGFLNRSGVSSP